MPTSLRSLLISCFFYSAIVQAQTFTGTLFEKGSQRQKILFHLDHQSTLVKNIPLKTVDTYTDTNGQKAHLETVSYDEQGKLKTLVIEQLQTGDRGELKVENGKVYFTWTTDGKTKTSDEKLSDNLVVAATLVPYLQSHWDTLLKGDDVDVRYAALDRRETVGFKFFKTAEKQVNGKNAIIVKMKASSFIIAAIVDPLYFTFDKDSKKLMELVGRTAPKQKVGEKWKDLDAEITYEYR